MFLRRSIILRFMNLAKCRPKTVYVVLAIALLCALFFLIRYDQLPLFAESMSQCGFLAPILQSAKPQHTSLWEEVDNQIGKSGKTLYTDQFDVDQVLRAMKTLSVTKVELFKPPTLKWILQLEGGQKMLFKPWLGPAYNNKSCTTGCEHPEYESVSFIVSRLLDLRTMPYTIGRVFSWERDLKPVASSEIKKLLKETDRGVCMPWKCRSYPVKEYCFHGGNISGSMMYWISRNFTEVHHRIEHKNSRCHPFHPIYAKFFQVYRPGENTYCEKIRQSGLYSNHQHFLYMLDMAVFDYIVMTWNSKHTYIVDYNSALINVFIDRGKGFCSDQPLLLAPIYQCCRIRKSVHRQLQRLNTTFQEEFLALAQQDYYQPLAPLSVVKAMQRRIGDILNYVDFCVVKYGMETVFL